MEIGAVRQVDINTEVKRAYLDYAMSVIVSRALPDVRDGLKPVQRRILYAMHDMGLRSDSAYKKSARIVGEVLGKYHPHGDNAVYDAMVRIAQDFSVRYPLVDGQGNFGSIDGDAPAAMRYTEARMASIATELLTDIDKDTIDWVDNFDGTLKEPAVLPAALPGLLINGSAGIAVGMSTSIPPHNLGEVVDALVYLLGNWGRRDDVGIDEIMQFIQGPDFPTGGLVYRRDREDAEDALLKSYATGRGRVTMRALAHVEEATRGRQRLVITEIPYQINKRSLEEKIAQLVRDGKLEGISDLRDESDRQGMRLVIELNQNADPDKVLQDLYRRTTLESRFSFILLALVNGEPRRLSLKRMLLLFIEHRLEVLTRRSRYLLDRARSRAHVVEGLLVALDNLDVIIDTIRRSRTPDTASRNLQRKLKLTPIQAQAILDMPLKRLVSLERRKLRQEYKDLQGTIQDLEALLASPEKQRRIISEDLQVLRARYDDTRRTHILDVKGTKVATEALTPDEPVWVTVSHDGLIGYVPNEGKSGPRVLSRPEALPLALLSASTRDTLYIFTARGDALALPVHQVSEGIAWEGEGVAWSAPPQASASHSEDGEMIAALTLPGTPPEGGMLFLATAQGKVKRLDPEELPAVGRGLTGVIRLDEGDRLVDVEWVQEADEVILASSAAQGIRFEVSEVRPSGARAGGVSGVRLDDDSVVVGVAVVRSEEMLLTITTEGLAKCSAFDELSSQRRGGKGVQVAKLEGQERLAGLGTISTAGRFFPVTQRDASKTVTARSVPTQGRATRGESIIALRDNDIVVGVVVQRDRIEEG